MRSFASSFAVALALAAAGPASAVESLVGTYEVKLSCRGQELGAAVHTRRTLAMRVISIDVGVVELDFLDGAERQYTDLPFFVHVAPETAKPERGILSGVSCDLSPGKGAGATLSSAVVTETGGDKVSLRGTLVVLGAEDGSQVCTLKAKRSSPDVPALADECSPVL